MEKAKYKYYVVVKEVRNNNIIIESDNPLTREDLIKEVEKDIEEGDLAYSHTLESDEWETGEL